MEIKEALNRIVAQLDLTTDEMKDVMRQIMTGQCTDVADRCLPHGHAHEERDHR